MNRRATWLWIGRTASTTRLRKDATKNDGAATDTDVAMMRRALDLAKMAARQREVPVGAVVYHTATGEIVAESYNTREQNHDPAGHAEFTAMRLAAAKLGDWRLTGCSVAVTLEPCPMCAGLVVNSRIERLVYGAPDPKAGAVRTLMTLADDSRLNHRAVVVPGVLTQECADVLRTFFRDLRASRV